MQQNVVTLYGELLDIPDKVEKEPSNDHCGSSLPGPEDVAGKEDAVVGEQDTRVNKDEQGKEMADEQHGLALPEETDGQPEKLPDGQPLMDHIDTASAVVTTPDENDHSGTVLGGNQAVTVEEETSDTEKVIEKPVPPPLIVQKPGQFCCLKFSTVITTHKCGCRSVHGHVCLCLSVLFMF